MPVRECRCLLHYLRLGGKSGVGCYGWVVMQSASGGQLANEKQERTVWKGVRLVDEIPVAAV